MTSLPFPEKFTYYPPAGFVFRKWQRECLDMVLEKLRATRDEQFTFLVSAGVGAGKTPMAAVVASQLLTDRTVQRVMYVCPNRAIKRAVQQTFHRFGVILVPWDNGKHAAHGEPVGFQGAVMTYQALAKSPDIHRRLCRIPTLVVFDEIHHLGDNQAWEVAARKAFEGSGALILSLSGTPYRADNRPIPFVTYLPEENGLRKFKPDCSHCLGASVAHGYCRKPHFDFLNAEVQVGRNGDVHVWDFNSEVSEETANVLLSGAVRPGSGSRKDILARAVGACRDGPERRKLIIFVGGDSSSDTLATEDAEVFLPAELLEMGLKREEFVSVTSNNDDAVTAIERFGESPAWVLITVNMVSEGVDIPQLSAALFLTSITAKATTVQRIGRVLRGSGSALIFMFRDRRYVELSQEIEDEIKQELLLRKPRQDAPANAEGHGFRRPAPDAVGLSAWPDGVTFNSNFYPQPAVDRANAHLTQRGLPHTPEYLGPVLELLEAFKL